ncbi:hypothetical protein FNV43_RR09769 [Rhamnella rubrinervis]|uniref:Uncharacterized protein n=1 Tax=Rhamnella rubrinervis TaxID=2594499 RepID=A0A8K0MKP0_9ROSA|nr:hypothetical protein FNV43_RR09769 [Rhamnella rubrinervis]
MPEWFSGMTRNHVDSARAGSNPAAHREASASLFFQQGSMPKCRRSLDAGRCNTARAEVGLLAGVASTQIVVDRPSLQISWSLFHSSSIVCKNRLSMGSWIQLYVIDRLELHHGPGRVLICRIMAFDPAWERWGLKPSPTVNLDMKLVNSLNAGSTTLEKSFGIAGGGVEALFNKNCASKQPSFVDVVNDLAREIDIPLKFDNSTITGNYGHYARVLIDVDLAGFILEKLLLETTDDCIEVELYFESFPDFCTSCHSVGHSVAKCKSVIGKMPSKDGSHINKKENKASVLNQVYKARQVPPQPIKSTTPSMPTTNAFDVLNTEVTPAYIEDMVHQHDATPSSMTNKMGIEVQSSAPDLGAATTRTDINTEMGNVPEDDDYADDFGEDEWPPLQGEGSSKPSNEFDDTPYTGQQSNTMVMVPIESSGALTTEQGKLDLVASQPNFSETTDQNLWNMVKKNQVD